MPLSVERSTGCCIRWAIESVTNCRPQWCRQGNLLFWMHAYIVQVKIKLITQSSCKWKSPISLRLVSWNKGSLTNKLFSLSLYRNGSTSKPCGERQYDFHLYVPHTARPKLRPNLRRVLAGSHPADRVAIPFGWANGKFCCHFTLRLKWMNFCLFFANSSKVQF